VKSKGFFMRDYISVFGGGRLNGELLHLLPESISGMQDHGCLGG